jgi:hypothetical protein
VRILLWWIEGVLMPRDFGKDGFELAEKVRQAGQPGWALRVEEAIKYGSTSTEILMALRWTIGEMVGEGIELPAATRILAEDIRRGIGKVLR